MQAIATEEPKFYACPFVSLVHAHRGQILSGQRGRQFAGAVRRCAMAENSGNLLFDFPCNRAPVAPLTQRAASTSVPQTREKEHELCLSLLLSSDKKILLRPHDKFRTRARASPLEPHRSAYVTASAVQPSLHSSIPPYRLWVSRPARQVTCPNCRIFLCTQLQVLLLGQSTEA